MREYIVPLYRRRKHEWVFLRHEDFCRDPEGVTLQIQKLIKIDRINMEESKDDILESIQEFIFPAKPTTAHEFHSVRMNSKEMIYNWKKELTEIQINIIKYQTKEMWSLFYGEEDW